MTETATEKAKISVIGKVGIGLLFAIGAAIVFFEHRRSPDELQPASTYFYSDNDGKSWFKDDAGKLVPFDHNGRPAYRAFIYRLPDGSTFCGYLQRLSDSALEQLRQLRQQPDTPEDQAKVFQITAFGTQVKKPGQATWVLLASHDGSMVLGQPPKAQAVEP